MLNAYRTSKLRDRCKILAAEWIVHLADVNKEEAKKYVEDSVYFSDNLWFDLKYSDPQNTDYAILRTLDHKIDIDVEVTTNGGALFVDLKPGFLGIRSKDNLNDLRITFALAATYVSRLFSEASGDVPNGFLSSQEFNTEVDFLKFMLNFNKWKTFQVITRDKKELPLEVFLAKYDE